MIGTVYLLHFAAPLGSAAHQAQHYLGWAANLAARLREHQAGQGAAITRAALERGIAFECVRVWEGADRSWERALKRRKSTPDLCPHCGGIHALRRACRIPAAQLTLDLDNWPMPPADRPDWMQIATERRMRAAACPRWSTVGWDDPILDIPW